MAARSRQTQSSQTQSSHKQSPQAQSPRAHSAHKQSPQARGRQGVVRRLEKAAGTLTTAAITQMERDLPWFRQLPAEDRSWIGLIVRSGISAFIDWFRDPRPGPAVRVDVFGTAPRALTRVVSLHNTVDMVRTTIGVVEAHVDQIAGPDDAPQVRDAVMRYAREVAFAAAEVYARAAEMRGAWDARLEALVVDSVLRGEADEAVRSRAAALGWQATGGVVVVMGHAPGDTEDGPADPESVVDDVRRSARQMTLDALAAVQGDRLVVVLGGVDDPDKAASRVVEHFGPGPVVVGPPVRDLLSANISARSAVAGLRAAPGWPEAPRPVSSEELLPERALAGDGHARRQLVSDVYQPLREHGSALLETVGAFVESGGSIEATARALFVHPNTVRYRLRRTAEVTGLNPANPRYAYTLRLALTLGRLLSPDS